MVSKRELVRLTTRLLGPLQRRVRLMVGRAVVELVDETTKCQSLQVTGLADEVREGVEHFQSYGFTSVPFKGAEAVLLAVGGNRDHCLTPCVCDRRYRPTGLEEGEVALFTDEGIKVFLKRGGEVHLGDKEAQDFVALATKVEDELSRIKDDLTNIKSSFDGHIHTTTATVGPSPALGVISPPTAPAASPSAPGSVAAETVRAK